MMEKICVKCGSDDWYIWSSGQATCAPCKLESNKNWDINNRDKRLAIVNNYNNKQIDMPRIRKNQHLKRKYNITIEQYEAMLIKQENLCAICRSETDKNWHLDHDHATGKVRGILCGNCNLMLGHSKDNQDILSSAINYLQHGADWFHERISQ